MAKITDFNNLSQDLINLLNSATEGTTKWANFFSDTVSSFYKNKNESDPKQWESSIFTELIKENVRLVLDKHNKVKDLLNWAK